MLLSTAKIGFTKNNSEGKGKSSTGTNKSVAMTSPRTMPTDLLISRSVGIVLILLVNLFLNC